MIGIVTSLPRIKRDVVILNTEHHCHPELVSGSQKLRRFRNKFGMTINNNSLSHKGRGSKVKEIPKYVLDYWQLGRLNAALPRTSFAIASLLPKSAVRNDNNNNSLPHVGGREYKYLFKFHHYW